MKKRKSLSPQTRVSYNNGWLKSLSNQEVIEIEKIKQLLSSTLDPLVKDPTISNSPLIAFQIPK